MPNSHTRIFLLSHMRAYTSLLGHILGSHPQINGYYEMHLSYGTGQALARQEQLYAQQDSFKPVSRYLFDKLLHNDYELNLQLPGLENAIVLLTLRQPEQTIKSILHLFAKKNTNDLYSYPAEATKYYIERLEKLAEFSHQHPQRYYYFDAEMIRTDTESMLKTLEGWLQLNMPLSARYQQFARTGVAGAGDTSTAIGSGKVLKQETGYGGIALKSSLLEEALQAYQACRNQLMRNMLT